MWFFSQILQLNSNSDDWLSFFNLATLSFSSSSRSFSLSRSSRSSSRLLSSTRLVSLLLSLSSSWSSRSLSLSRARLIFSTWLWRCSLCRRSSSNESRSNSFLSSRVFYDNMMTHVLYWESREFSEMRTTMFFAIISRFAISMSIFFSTISNFCIFLQLIKVVFYNLVVISHLLIYFLEKLRVFNSFHAIVNDQSVDIVNWTMSINNRVILANVRSSCSFYFFTFFSTFFFSSFVSLKFTESLIRLSKIMNYNLTFKNANCVCRAYCL